MTSADFSRSFKQCHLPTAEGLERVLCLLLHGLAEHESQLSDVQEGVLVCRRDVRPVQLDDTPVQKRTESVLLSSAGDSDGSARNDKKQTRLTPKGSRKAQTYAAPRGLGERREQADRVEESFIFARIARFARVRRFTRG